MNLRRLLLPLLALAAVACSPTATSEPDRVEGLDAAFELDRLVIVNDDGKRIQFDVYLARNFEQQARGLMFVRSMPEYTGMLFVYDSDAIRSMWMKNTYIPLDMVFARADGSVSSVINDTVPLTLTSRASQEPVRYVLELNAGTARRHNIGRGSRLEWDDGGR